MSATVASHAGSVERVWPAAANEPAASRAPSAVTTRVVGFTGTRAAIDEQRGADDGEEHGEADPGAEHLVEHAGLGDRADPRGRSRGWPAPAATARTASVPTPAAAVRSPRLAARSRSSPNHARTVEPPAASSRPA